jgi:hypothetical protein
VSGPPPKRSDERRRRNAPAAGEPEKRQVDGEEHEPGSLPFLIAQPIEVPEPEYAWHPIAKDMWDSFSRSGQALYWEPSDWMLAKLFCESLSRDLNPQIVGIAPANEFGPAEAIKDRIPLKGASLAAYLKLAGQLMLTEGERRRVALELERTRAQKQGDDGAKILPFKDRRAAMLRGVDG